MDFIKTRASLSEQQNQAIDFIKAHKKCAIWADMGTGKTIATLTAIADLIADFEVGRVLIIAPKRVIEETWPTEIVQWQHINHLRYTLINGTEKQRLERLKEKTEIHLISRDNITWLVRLARNRKWPYDMVVIDEASSFKNHDSKRFKAMRSRFAKIRRLVELTGTPASNGYMNLWAQVFLLDAGERLYKTITAYRNNFFIRNYNGYGYELRRGAAQTIENAIRDIVLRLEYPHTSQPTVNNMMLALPSEAKKEYKKLCKEFLIRLDDDIVIDAPNAAVLSMRLHQFANGAVYEQDEAGENIGWVCIHDEKLDALENIIDETGSPILVAYNFKHDLRRLKARFPYAKTLDDANAVADWNAGKVPLLLAHPASAGHGLNLQYGGNVIVWFSLNWSLELYAQFNARLHRQGQAKQVIIHHLMMRDTVDEIILDRLKGKYKTEKELLDAMKAQILKKY